MVFEVLPSAEIISSGPAALQLPSAALLRLLQWHTCCPGAVVYLRLCWLMHATSAPAAAKLYLAAAAAAAPAAAAVAAP
jgi:hypothetical protein